MMDGFAFGPEPSDEQKYEALEAELAETGGDPWIDDDGPADDVHGRMHSSEDDGGGETARHNARTAAVQEDDDDGEERAALEADELQAQWEERARYAQQHRQPDIYEDPIGALQTMQRELAEHRSKESYKQFLDQVDRQESDFLVIQPDYHEAAAMLERHRRDELAQMYPDKSAQAHLVARQHGCRTPKELRDKILVSDAQAVARNAMMAGVNPAKAYYDLAVQRGWKSKHQAVAMSRSGKNAGKLQRGMSADALAELYVEDPDAFDKQWDKMARAGALG